MRDTSNKDSEYLEALQREVYYDVAFMRRPLRCGGF